MVCWRSLPESVIGLLCPGWPHTNVQVIASPRMSFLKCRFRIVNWHLVRASLLQQDCTIMTREGTIIALLDDGHPDQAVSLLQYIEVRCITLQGAKTLTIHYSRFSLSQQAPNQAVSCELLKSCDALHSKNAHDTRSSTKTSSKY